MSGRGVYSISRWRAVRPIIAGLITVPLMLALASSNTSRASTSHDDQAPITNNAPVDLCALMAEAAPIQTDRLNPGVGAEVRGWNCRYSPLSPNKDDPYAKPFDNVYLTMFTSVEDARAAITSWHDAVPATFPVDLGDSGYGYELAGSEELNGTDARIRFARNCFHVEGEAGYQPISEAQPSSLRDPGAMREYMAALDKVLQKTPCSEPEEELDLTIDHMEVVQVVQTADNKIPLVAGKKTVVRVFLKASGTALGGVASNVKASLFYWPEGGSELELKPVGNGSMNVTPGTAPERYKTEGSLNFVIPAEQAGAGFFDLRAVVNPSNTVKESKSDNNELSQPFEFMQRNGLRIGYIRIGSKLPGNAEYQWPTGVFAKADSFLRKIYPAADAGIQYYELPFRARITAELGTFKGGQLLREMRELYDRIDKDKPDILFGWLANDIGIADFGGLAPLGEPVSIGIDYNTDHSRYLLAHEIGHDLELNHTGTGTSVDPAADCQKSYNFSFSYWPAEYGASARIREFGFDTGEMKVVPDTHYDIMAYCSQSKTWISPFHYKKLYDGNLRSPGMGLLRRGYDKFARVRGYILFMGNIAQFEVVRPPEDTPEGGADGTQALFQAQATNPLLSFAGWPGSVGAPYSAFARNMPALQEGTGNYCLRFLDAGGVLLYEQCFEPQVLPPVSEAEQPEEGYFALTMPDPGSAAAVVLVHKEDGQETELSSLTVSANAPGLTITSPKAGDRWEGEHTIEWSGSDADGDQLRYDIEYSADSKQSWYPLAVGSNETSFTFSTEEILPSDQTYIRVMASDGYNTTATDVGPLVVPAQPNSPKPPSGDGSDSGTGTGSTVSPGVTPDSSLLYIIGGGALVAVVGLTMVLVMRRSRPKPAMAGATQAAPQATYQPTIPPAQPTYQPPNQPPYQPPQQPAPPVYSPANMGAALDPLQAAEQEYWRLRNALAAGQIPIQQYQALVRQLVVRDAGGYSWMLGEADGLWYVYDGRAWVRADPRRSG